MVLTISYKDFIMIQTFNNGFYCDTISQNDFLDRNLKLYWRYNYISSNFIGGSVKDQQMSEDIRTLKNQFRDKKINFLQSCYQRIRADVDEGLQILVKQLAVTRLPCVAVAVPRSKATFCDDQLYLIKAISDAITLNGMENGAYFIQRHSDTKTTHLMNTKIGDMNKTGDAPYPGITGRTCNLDGDVRGKNVILIDDIYTGGVNVDEDCAQFLFDNGARNVVLYALCKT